MAFTFDADPQALIRERTPQFVGLGVPRDTIEQVAPYLKDLWCDGPGGWVHEWSLAARIAQRIKDHLLASLLFGIAKYPCLGNAAHKEAYHNQLEAYLRASRSFPQHFERHVLSVAYRDQITRVPVHILRDQSVQGTAPVVMMLGGVDTWKMDIHNSATYLSKVLHAHVALVDMPGVGESGVPNAPDGDEVLNGVGEQLRPIGNGRLGVLAFSFGGLWAVKLALMGRVDVAAAAGACVSSCFARENLKSIPNGMPGILGNSFFLDAPFPDLNSLATAMAPFSLRSQGLYEWSLSRTPLLLVNGCDDPYVPQSDVLDFSSRPATVARLIPHATHCAAERMSDLMPWILSWLGPHLQYP
jgi:esterase FrsA